MKRKFGINRQEDILKVSHWFAVGNLVFTSLDKTLSSQGYHNIPTAPLWQAPPYVQEALLTSAKQFNSLPASVCSCHTVTAPSSQLELHFQSREDLLMYSSTLDAEPKESSSGIKPLTPSTGTAKVSTNRPQARGAIYYEGLQHAHRLTFAVV